MIQVGLIGCGGMSRNFAERLRMLEPRMRVTATADLDPVRAHQAAEVLGAKQAVTDYRQILDCVDAVLLVLPHHEHHPVAMNCLAAGKHVMLEKPMANTEQQCLELIAAARQADRVLMIAYVMRYHPLTLAFKQAIDDGRCGEVFQLSLWTEQHTHYPEGHWTRNSAQLGGGQLFSHGCHYIDLLLWLLGRPVEGTHTGTRYGTPWMEREGTSNVVIKFESGAIGYHFGTWGARGTRLRYSFHAHGTRGMLEADFARGRLVLHRDAAFISHDDEAHRQLEGLGAKEDVLFECEPTKYTDREVGHFLDCIETGRQPETDGWQSLQGLRVIWRLYDAERNGVVADLRGLAFDQRESPAPTLVSH